MKRTLPTKQYHHDGMPRLDEATLYERREHLFLLLSGIFLGTLAMLNILGISRFIELSVFGLKMPLAVGVLPYPITFLCTDLICELYGRRRANAVVAMGAVLNVWVMSILWLGGELPGVGDPDKTGVFFQVQKLAFGAVTASMVAYVVAQLVDVQLFHFWKRLTKGRHLWLRNNGSTMVSQLVDTTAVILVTHFYAHALPIDVAAEVWPQLMSFIIAGYTFKLAVALLDTGPFYAGVHYLTRYLRLPPPAVAEAEQPTP